MSQPRNIVAIYVEGRSQAQLDRLAAKLTLASRFQVVAGAPAGWLLAAEPHGEGSSRHSSDAGVLSIEAPKVGAWPSAGVERAVRAPGAALLELGDELAFCAIQPHGALRAVRSCGGLVPLYYYVSPTSVCVATRLRDLFWLCPAELQPDELVQAIWSAGNAVFPDERTFLRDVKILPKGHWLSARPGQARVERYWEPRPSELPEPSPKLVAEHALELRGALLDALADGLSVERTNLLTLSGGVDSSSLAVLGKRSLERPLATLTFVAPQASPARRRQLSYVEPLLDELGVRERHLLDAEDAYLDGLFSTPLSALYQCPHPALRLLPELGKGFATLVSGHFADEVCGYSQRRQDWVRHTRLARLLQPRWPAADDLRDALRWCKRRSLNALGRELLPLPRPLGRIYGAELKGELLDWLRRTRARILSDRRPLRELATWVELDAWVAMHWDVASAQGVRPVHPFFNRAVLELAFRCHPVELFGPGFKKILRRALADLVPERYLQRPDKGHWHRPPRRDLGTWHGRLSTLASCVDARFREPGPSDLSSAERRQLTQLALFEVALTKARAFRASLGEGSG